jgi:DNA repair exonuclease SbcCD ATPase subunit
MSVDELISLYRETGLEEKDAKEAVSNLILAMNRRQRTNFLTYNTPKNLKDKLGDQNYAPLVEFQKDTPTYKAFRGQLEDRLDTPDLDSEQRKELINRLLESYARGEDLGTELGRFFGEVVRSTDEEISRLQGEKAKLEQEKNEALQQANQELEQIQTELDQLVQEKEKELQKAQSELEQIKAELGGIPEENVILRNLVLQEKEDKQKQIEKLEQELKNIQQEFEQRQQNKQEQIERLKQELQNIEEEFEQRKQDLESKKSRIETGRATAQSSLVSIIGDHENIAKQFSPEISTSLSQTQKQQSSQTPKQSS